MQEKDGSSEAIDPEKLAMRLQQAVVDMDKKAVLVGNRNISNR